MEGKMNFLTINWKTTAAGVLALAGVAYKFWTTKTVSPEDITAVLIAFGLIAAKDVNVTGGNVDQ